MANLWQNITGTVKTAFKIGRTNTATLDASGLTASRAQALPDKAGTLVVQLASGKVDGITGGTATGEVMTQDQFGANSVEMVTSGTPQFAKVGAGIDPTADDAPFQASTTTSYLAKLNSSSVAGLIGLYESNVARAFVGYGDAGNLFSLALTNSLGIRSEAAIHIGCGSSVGLTMRESGYGPGTCYIAVGGHTDPLSVFEVGGEASPELGIRSNTTGSRWTLQSHSDGALNVIDRTASLDRLKVGTGGDVSLSTSAAWFRGINAASALQPLIRSRGYGYSVSTYPGVQVGQTGDHIALFIDPASVAGGNFSGNVNELLLPNATYIIQANAGSTDWLARTMSLVNGEVGIGMTPARTLDVTGTFGVTGIATHGAPITIKGYTVAGLPTGVTGHVAYVTDALAPAYGVAVAGGGSIVTPVFYNGAAWVAH